MKKYLITAFLFLVIKTSSVFPQSGYSYREYSRDRCLEIEREFNRRPDELSFFPEVKGNTIYMVFDNKEWFDNFFDRPFLRLGIKLVASEYFTCELFPGFTPDDYFYYLPPLQYSTMKENMFESDGTYKTPMGVVPHGFINRDYDYGMIISYWRRECSANWMRAVKVHEWEFMENALLVDSLVYHDDIIKIETDTLPVVTTKKKSFKVNFPKDETTYDKNALHSFILNLPTDNYNVMDINILAYASVEGPEERNVELYEKRAEVVYKELMKFFGENIIYQCIVEENWDAFYADVTKTEYRYLSSESKETVREYLSDEITKEELEPILENHRYATIDVTLYKKLHVKESSVSELFGFYSDLLENKDLENALKIQDEIFYRVKNEDIAVDFPAELPIPDSKEFSYVMSRDYSYRYNMGVTDIKETYKLFKELPEIFPDCPIVRFNIAELMFRLWLLDDSEIADQELFNTITSLSNYDVPENAANRLLVNYYILQAENGRKNDNRRLVNTSLRRIRNLYSNADLREDEILSIAMFFSAYREYTLAERFLRPHAQKSQPDEDILFYYLDITIADERGVRTRRYQNLLETALELNPQRFCEMFEPHSTGGKGISTLFNETLKEMFCEFCD